MNKLSNEQLKEYLIKEAGPLGDIINQHSGVGTPESQQARDALAEQIRKARGAGKAWETDARSIAQSSFNSDKRLYDLAENLDKKYGPNLGAPYIDTNIESLQKILRKGTPSLEEAYKRHNLTTEGRGAPGPAFGAQVALGRTPELSHGYLDTSIPVRGTPGQTELREVGTAKNVQNALFGKTRHSRSMSGNNPQVLADLTGQLRPTYTEGPLHGLGQGAQALIEKLKGLYGQHIAPGIENIMGHARPMAEELAGKARTMAAEAKPAMQGLAGKAKDIFSKVKR